MCIRDSDNSAPLTGLLYGGGTTVLAAQVVGSAIVTVATLAVGLIVMYVVNAIGILRVSAEGERYGLDLHEHGISAYPEYVIAVSAMPAGMAGSHSEMSAVPHTSAKPVR